MKIIQVKVNFSIETENKLQTTSYKYRELSLTNESAQINNIN